MRTVRGALEEELDANKGREIPERRGAPRGWGSLGEQDSRQGSRRIPGGSEGVRTGC